MLSLASASFAQDQTENFKWTPVHIGSGGFVRGMVIHPTDPDVRYARADVDNIYRWDTKTNRWAPMKVASAFNAEIKGAPSSGAEGPLAVDPNNPNIVLAAYSFARSSDLSNNYPNINLNVYRSTDGGLHFKAGNLSLAGTLNSDTQGERLAIDPNDSSLVYFGSPQNGLWRSLDGGVHFENVVSGGAPKNTTNVAMPRFDTSCGTAKLLDHTVSKCLFLTLTGGSILRSGDGGNTWTNISAGQRVDGSPGFVTVDSKGKLWTTDGTTEQVYVYSKAGVWTTLTTPIYGITGIAVDPVNVKRAFIIGGAGALTRTLDGGKTWTSLGDGLYFSETQKINGCGLRRSVRRVTTSRMADCTLTPLESYGRLAAMMASCQRCRTMLRIRRRIRRFGRRLRALRSLLQPMQSFLQADDRFLLETTRRCSRSTTQPSSMQITTRLTCGATFRHLVTTTMVCRALRTSTTYRISRGSLQWPPITFSRETHKNSSFRATPKMAVTTGIFSPL